jgi:YggT family protein
LGGIFRDILEAAFTAYYVLIIIRIVLSWIPHNPHQHIFKFIYEVTEPYLQVFRKYIPPLGMIDISPIIALIALRFLKYFIDMLLPF